MKMEMPLPQVINSLLSLSHQRFCWCDGMAVFSNNVSKKKTASSSCLFGLLGLLSFAKMSTSGLIWLLVPPVGLHYKWSVFAHNRSFCSSLSPQSSVSSAVAHLETILGRIFIRQKAAIITSVGNNNNYPTRTFMDTDCSLVISIDHSLGNNIDSLNDHYRYSNN